MVRRALLLSLPLLAACGADPELTAKVASLEAENAKLKQERDRLDKESDTLNGQVRRLQDEINRLKLREAYTKLGIDEGDSLSATLDTSRGRITCALWPDKAPETVLNFVQLAEGTRAWTDPTTGQQVERPLYDGTVFHRVIPNFMIQGGDPEGTGRGGPGYTFADETDSGVGFDEPGLLAMANRGPDTNGSQFFITDRATPHHLDGKHTIFGKCDNLDVVQEIAEADRDRRDKPTADVVIRRVAITRG